MLKVAQAWCHDMASTQVAGTLPLHGVSVDKSVLAVETLNNVAKPLDVSTTSQFGMVCYRWRALFDFPDFVAVRCSQAAANST